MYNSLSFMASGGPERQRFNGRKGQRRLDYLFSRLSVPAEEAYGELDRKENSRRKNYERARKKGSVSEEKVAQVLREMKPKGLVESVGFCKEQKGMMDRDLVVMIRVPEEVTDSRVRRQLEAVYVQVKSSEVGMEKFRRQLETRFELDREAAQAGLVVEMMARDKLILIRANMDEEEIGREFERQFWLVVDYWERVFGARLIRD